ncbi:GNAT family N-acetyltransferase [Caenimonas sedimenti]|uniref:GNAT family N-acetyltransferase n=1 Tax=Caenimonas sedimenti TaxID=2596921 RepID=A0A562ZUU8_9BURK|nr:GNAT family N-acetyltransferase [Caenimonas sedimenti]TWO72157.1 GNAT family N-acetyltransferase [Caenimonas sedimenti]
MIEWSDSLADVDWHELVELYRVAPLGTKQVPVLQTSFSNSRYRWFVRDEGRLVGVGRALADGADCSYICDIAVHPSHQGTGLGKAIVAKLLEQSRGHKKILLYAAPGKEPFYRRFGFERMLTAMAIFENQAAARERGYLSDT